jgi:ABC-2 type transport system ATP-binding protein
VQGKHAIWERIREQQAQGKTFVVSTNDMAEAEALCDRLLIIDHGRNIAQGTPELLKNELGRDIVTIRTTPAIGDPNLMFADLGVRDITSPEPNLVRLEVQDAESILGDLVTRVTANHRLESVRMSRPTLDDVFLHHTGRALRD